jgi:hypothetical protein
MNNPLTIKLADVMMQLYEGDNKTFNDLLVTGTVHRSIMLNIYGLLIKDGTIIKIEDLIPDEKEKLWVKCKEIIDGRLSKEHCVEVTKAIYTLDIISQQ